MLYASVLFYIIWSAKMHTLQWYPCLSAYEIWGISCWFCMCGIRILLNPVFVVVVPTLQKQHVGAYGSCGLVWKSICVTKVNPHDEDKKTRSKSLGLQGPLIHGGLHVIVTLMVLSTSVAKRGRGCEFLHYFRFKQDSQ